MNSGLDCVLLKEFKDYYKEEKGKDAQNQPLNNEFFGVVFAFLYTKIDQLVEDKIRKYGRNLDV